MTKNFDATMHIDIDGISIGDVPLSVAREAYGIALKYLGQAKTEANIEGARREIDKLVRDYRIFRPVYLGHWNIKEENNMNIPGKLREDLKRIYGPIDPLDCIEDILMTENHDETLLQVTLRVPRRCERFLESSPLYADYVMEGWARDQAHMMEECMSLDIHGVPEPEKVENHKKKDTLDSVKPDRVVYSGPKTIVFWPDGTKTMVSLMEGQEHDEYGAFCAAIVKKMFGATHKAKKFLESVKVLQTPKVVKKVKSDDYTTVEYEDATDSDWIGK